MILIGYREEHLVAVKTFSHVS